MITVSDLAYPAFSYFNHHVCVCVRGGGEGEEVCIIASAAIMPQSQTLTQNLALQGYILIRMPWMVVLVA